MDNYDNPKFRIKRSYPLIDGECKCGQPATLPWEGIGYCVKCWVEIPKGGNNGFSQGKAKEEE